MCNCISALEAKGFIEREATYEDHDFKEKGYMIRKYNKTSRGIKDTHKVFRLNYCPACGDRILQVTGL